MNRVNKDCANFALFSNTYNKRTAYYRIIGKDYFTKHKRRQKTFCFLFY